MKFSDIDIYTKPKYKNTKDEQHLLTKELENNKYLMNYWENIRNLFSMNIPSKFEFLGISKFNIQLGDFEGDSFLPASENGIATFRRNDFCFEKFKELSNHDKNIHSLFYLEDSLITTCKMHKLSNEIVEKIESICSLIREWNFECTQIHKKTSKWHSSRKIRAITNLHHKTNGIDVSFRVSDKKGNDIIKEVIITNEFWENIWYALWKGYWNGTTYIIENRVGKEIYKVETSLSKVT